jgi:FKBP-type peptidyl-prolyl cis-trans isomerase
MRIFTAAAFALAVVATAALALPSDLSPAANATFLSNNAKKPGVITANGIQYRVIKAGKGQRATAFDCATVFYKGNLINGKVFDQTQPNQPATFPVGALIKGWTTALEMMHTGDEWELVIPSGLAYGSRGAGHGVIPPDQTLVFDLQLLKVDPSEQGQCF